MPYTDLQITFLAEALVYVIHMLDCRRGVVVFIPSVWSVLIVLPPPERGDFHNDCQRVVYWITALWFNCKPDMV